MKSTPMKLVIGVALVATTMISAPLASGADINSTYPSWGAAASALGTGGSLWNPANTAGLSLNGKVTAIAQGVTLDSNGIANGGSTFAGATYGTSKKKTFTVSEYWQKTTSAADPATDIASAPVGMATINLGMTGMTVPVKATISANCYTKAYSGNAAPPAKSFRCSKNDVLKYGGNLTMLAQPSNSMGAPGNTYVNISTDGISYQQLLAIATSMQQVSG